MICEVFNGTYKIGTAPWNALSKSEYLQILQFMRNIGETALSDNQALQSGKDQSVNSLKACVTVFRDQMRRSEYSEDEFRSMFSCYVPYEALTLTVSNAAFAWSYKFSASSPGPGGMGRGFVMSTDCFTLPQMEALADTANRYVEQLFSRYSLPVSSKEVEFEQDSSAGETPNAQDAMPQETVQDSPKQTFNVQNAMLQQDSIKGVTVNVLVQNQECHKPDMPYSVDSGSDSNKKPCKRMVLKTIAVTASIATIFTAIFMVLTHFGLI